MHYINIIRFILINKVNNHIRMKILVVLFLALIANAKANQNIKLSPQC
jgi:hypothetical protein